MPPFSLSNLTHQIRYRIQQGDPLILLIAINALVFILYHLAVFLLSPSGENQLFALLALPAQLGTLLVRPWTLITYMFFHVDLLHILFNMLWFCVFGRIFLQFFTRQQLWTLYLVSGLLGGVLYVLAFNVIPYFQDILPYSMALGASAAVMGITLAAIVRAPNAQVYLYGVWAVRVKWIGIATVALDLLSILGSNAGGHIAHLGGAAAGVLFGWYYAKRRAVVGRFPTPSLLSFLGYHWRRWRTSKRQPSAGKQHTPRAAQNPSEIDSILKKLAKGGYSALTDREKQQLFDR